jgi:hypothetical protein
LWLVTFYLRPAGILPERRHVAKRGGASSGSSLLSKTPSATPPTMDEPRTVS